MCPLKTLGLLFAGIALSQARATSSQLPVVDLDYAIHQSTFNVCNIGCAILIEQR